jgi:hypothetical protein
MFYYVKNILGDMVFGYIEVVCCNNNCKRVFKLSRNKYYNSPITTYSCNMGCALESYNQFEKQREEERNRDLEKDLDKRFEKELEKELENELKNELENHLDKKE